MNALVSLRSEIANSAKSGHFHPGKAKSVHGHSDYVKIVHIVFQDNHFVANRTALQQTERAKFDQSNYMLYSLYSRMFNSL